LTTSSRPATGQLERTHYRQPSDQIQSDWNFDGMIENAQLGFAVGVKLANGDQLPAWIPGDELEAALAH
jgi:lysozyme family protein